MTSPHSTRKALIERLDSAFASRTEKAASGSVTPPAIKISMNRVPVLTKARRGRLEAAARDPKTGRKHFALIAAD